MNGLHDLLEKLKKLEEAAAAPTTFTPNYYHKSNLGGITPLMMTDPGVFWKMGTATNDDGTPIRGGGGGQTIQRWYGNTESRDALSPASVDGFMVNGKPGPEWPDGATWRTELAKAEKAKTDAQNAQKVSSANTGGASSALVQNREQLAPGTVASETGSDGVTYGVDANGQRTYKLDTQAQKWVKLATPVPAEQGELAAQAKPVAQSGTVTSTGGDATVGTVPSVSQGSAATVPADITANLARVKQIIGAMKEGIKFKSRIGHALLESFDLKLNEDAASDLAELNKIWPSCVNWAKDPANASTDVAKDIEKIAPQVTAWQGKAQSNVRVSAGGNSALKIPGVDTVADITKQVTSVQGGDATVGTVPSVSRGDAVATDTTNKAPALPQAVLDLAKANGIEDPNSIKAGNTIVLGDGKTKYTIVKGDTLADIAAGKFKGVDPTKTTGTVSAPVAAPVAADKTTTATTIKVRKGDTLTSIAKSCTPPVTVDDLIKVNPGIDPKKLRIDQTINLPANVKAGILPAGDAPKVADAIPKITDVPPMPDLPEPPPPKRETGLIGTLTDDPTYQNWLRKNVKDTKSGDLYWVNGERYEATPKRGRLTWIKDQPFGNAERTAQLRNYTGPDSGADAFATAQQKIWTAAQQARIAGKVKESTGFIDDELNRIVSLVHHR